MAAQNGKDLLIKIDDGSGAFVTVAGLRATRIAFNAETVDVTTLESEGGWRELLAGAGMRSASLSGSGIFKDAQSDSLIKNAFFGNTVPRFEVVVPDFGRIQGSFQITALEYAGNYNGEATYELSLASAGALSFTAV
jgi:TP901-1 family phage major tail protein